jgi:hypothetical protein
MRDIFSKGKSLIDKDIVKLEVPFINFDGKEELGLIEVHKNVKDEVIKIFNEIKEIGFPIFKMETIDNYEYDDEKSVVANNTSAYNFRFVSGTTKLSDHAIGLAIDINPKQNPWIHPSALNKFPYIPGEKGTIEKGDDVVSIFEKYGWSWGGNWRNPDYQHFFKGGDINKNIKNKLYDDLGIDNPYLQNQPKGRIHRFKDFVKRIIK